VSPNTTVKEFKVLVSEKMVIVTSGITLIYAGKQLQDKEDL